MAAPDSLVLGGGCFWCVEAVYESLRGVISVVPGYSGGSVPDPTYEEVCLGTTGHIEVVRVTYDSDVISLRDIVSVFWVTHDPTSLNRQGADIGPQYASVLFYEDESQKEQLVASKRDAQRYLETPIVTHIVPLEVFYEAEPEHHRYFQKHPDAAYCQVVIEPKLAKLRQHFSPLLTP